MENSQTTIDSYPTARGNPDTRIGAQTWSKNQPTWGLKSINSRSKIDVGRFLERSWGLGAILAPRRLQESKTLRKMIGGQVGV